MSGNFSLALNEVAEENFPQKVLELILTLKQVTLYICQYDVCNTTDIFILKVWSAKSWREFICKKRQKYKKWSAFLLTSLICSISQKSLCESRKQKRIYFCKCFAQNTFFHGSTCKVITSCSFMSHLPRPWRKVFSATQSIHITNFVV